MSNAHAVHSLGSFDAEIVIDLGCCSYERNGRLEDSIQTLIKRFKPMVLFGFDPHPAMPDGIGTVYGTTVLTSRRAAWTHDGKMGLEIQGNCTHVQEDARDSVTRVFDIAAWMRTLPEAKTVLKIDIEGAEYVILPHLIELGLISRFDRILVEWHEGKYANGYEADRESILSEISCPVETWQ